MAGIGYKYIEMSKNYKGLARVMDEHGNYWWSVKPKGGLIRDEKEAAKKYDLMRILAGKEPVNILTRKVSQ